MRALHTLGSSARDGAARLSSRFELLGSRGVTFRAAAAQS